MRSPLQRCCFGLAGVLFALGPATGAERALHLAGAAEHHDSRQCTVCLDLTIEAHVDQLLVPAASAWGDPPPTRMRPASDQAPLIVKPCRAHVPRAPPA